jgi:hypothetical protein
MKLSDKILLGFFGVIFIYLTAAFAEVRLSGTLNVLDDRSGIVETAEIPRIAYVVLNDFDKDIIITGSDRDRIEMRSLSGDVLKGLAYEVSGDTLRLLGIRSKINDPVRVSIFVSEHVKGLVVNSSRVIMQDVNLEQLHITQVAGRVSMSDSKIAEIELDLSNGSDLDISGIQIDTVSARIERSQVNIFSSVSVLRCSMKDNSFLNVRDIEDVRVKKDKSSRLIIQ